MKIRNSVKLAGLAVLCVCSVGAGYWLAQDTIDDLAAKNRAIAEQDSLKQVSLDDTREAYQRAVLDFSDYRELKEAAEDSMSDQIAALLESEERKDRRIETLIDSRATIRDSLESVLSGIVVTDSSVRAELQARNDYEDGYIAADGTVEVDLRNSTGTANLFFDARLSPVVSISRDDQGLAQCTVTFGDMPITVEDLRCMNDLNPDLPVRDDFWDFAPKLTFGTVTVAAALLTGILLLK